MPATVICMSCLEALPEEHDNHLCFIGRGDACAACGSAAHKGNPLLPTGVCWRCSSVAHYNAGVSAGVQAASVQQDEQGGDET